MQNDFLESSAEQRKKNMLEMKEEMCSVWHAKSQPNGETVFVAFRSIGELATVLFSLLFGLCLHFPALDYFPFLRKFFCSTKFFPFSFECLYLTWSMHKVTCSKRIVGMEIEKREREGQRTHRRISRSFIV